MDLPHISSLAITHNFCTDIAHFSIVVMAISFCYANEQKDKQTERQRDIVILRAADLSFKKSCFEGISLFLTKDLSKIVALFVKSPP